MQEKVLNALSEIEDALSAAIADCKDKVEASATLIIITQSVQNVATTLLDEWTPKTETEAKHGEISF